MPKKGTLGCLAKSHGQWWVCHFNNLHFNTGAQKITAKAELMALLKILSDAKFTEVTGPQRRRVLVLLRDVSNSNVVSGIQAYLEAMGGLSVVSMESLSQLTGAPRQRTLRRLREKVQQEMYLLGEALPCYRFWGECRASMAKKAWSIPPIHSVLLAD
ncbi:unnamed protein product [Cladocopium goreaui]|uniref:Uncharacterized protein n=1 Tax=Cladocopium goreaui TaxID=2562237 RepID=A0A9P1C9L5_9DINO|nr:unnamed protein product [Cladocopium goreaui]